MSQSVRFRFRLYVADNAPNSAQAIANLAVLCRTHLPDRHEIEVVDVFQQPKRALADRIFMTPTLVKLAPFPVRTIVGTLSQTQLVLEALGLHAVAASSLGDWPQRARYAGWDRRRTQALVA